MRRPGLFLGVLLCTANAVFAQSPAPPLPAPTTAALGPYTLTPASVACIDTPATAAPGAALQVIGPQMADRRENAVRGDVVVLSGGAPAGLAIGQQYFTRRL